MNTVDQIDNLDTEPYTRSLRSLKIDRYWSIAGIAGSLITGYFEIFEMGNSIPYVRAVMIGTSALVGFTNAHELGVANEQIANYQINSEK